MNLYSLSFCSFFFITSVSASYTAWKADEAYRAGDLSQARALYEDAVVKNPQDMQSLYNVGKMAHKEKDYVTAEKTFALVAQQSAPLKEAALFNGGDAQLMQKKYADAEKSFEKVLALNPQNKHAQERLELCKKLREEQQKEQQSTDKNQSKNNQQSNSDQSSSGEDLKNSSQDKGADQSQDRSGSQKNSDTGDQGQEGSENSKGNNRTPDQSEQKSNDSPQSNTDKPNKPEQPTDKEQAPKKDSGSKGDTLPAQTGISQGDAEKEKQGNGQKKHGENEPQKKDVNSNSIAESHLTPKERAELDKVDDHDKRTFKRFFGGRNADHRGSAGKKNW